MAGGASFASSASLLVVLQLLSRAFTFVLNQALLRFVSPQAFGTAAIQFELLLNTILFLSREGFRNALLRAWPRPDDRQEHAPVPSQVKNLALVPIAIGLPLSALLAYGYLETCSDATRHQPYFDMAVALYALAAVVELISEPMHIRTMGELRTIVRVRAEGLAVILKTSVTFAVLYLDPLGHKPTALAAFALGQLTYALVLLFIYVIHYGVGELRVSRAVDSRSTSYFDGELFRLSLGMTAQSLLKHLLTEGDKIFVSRLSPLRDQGGYAVASNYGSLVARIVFQPIEEMSRVFFSKTLSAKIEDDKSTDNKTASNITPSALARASNVLNAILSTQIIASLVLVSIGPAYLPAVLPLLLPSRYLATNVTNLLSAWLWYIPLLAINGVLEAFVSSVSSAADLKRQSWWMALFSAAYIGATATFYATGYQDTSLIYGNIFNLFLRILFSASFAQAYFARRHVSECTGWNAIVPKPITAALVALCIGAVQTSQHAFLSNPMVIKAGNHGLLTLPGLSHVLVGGLGALVIVFSWWLESGRATLIKATNTT